VITNFYLLPWVIEQLQNTVDSYLKKNPVMEKVWENAGWQIDHTENS